MVCSFFFFFSAAGAPTYVAASGGNDGTGCGAYATPCASIQYAISLGSNEIVLMPGVHSQTGGLGPAPVNGTIRSESGDPADTEINCGGHYGFWAIGSLTLEGVTMSRCEKSNGGAVSSSYRTGGPVVIESCVFRECKSTYKYGGDGGAVHQTGGTLTVTNTTFTGNSAQYGGAVYIHENFAEFSDTVFESNHADGSGGAGVLSECHTILSNTHFVNNTAAAYGGALYLRSWDEQAYIADFSPGGNVIQDNTAGEKGGGIAISGDDLVLFMEVSSAIVLGNAPDNIYDETGAYSCHTCFQAQSCDWSVPRECSCPGDGSDLDRRCQVATLYVSAPPGGQPFPCGWDSDHACNSLLEAWRPGLLMDSVVLLQGTHRLTDSLPSTPFALSVQSMSGNAADTAIDCQGHGGFYHAALTLRGVTMRNCKRADGGAVYADGDGPIVIERCRFESCEATRRRGGAVYQRGTNLTVTDTVFVNNTSTYDGGAVRLLSGHGHFTGAIFDKNSARIDGGAVNLYGNATFWNTTFESNSADDDGGAVNLYGNATFWNTTFESNSADDGGAVYMRNGNGTFWNTAFDSNSASYGGAIRAWYGDGTFWNTSFTGNTAHYSGGAVYGHGNGTFQGTFFDGNSASQFGGAVSMSGGNVVFMDAAFTSNDASDGGAVYMLDVNGWFQDASFEGNSALGCGGAARLSRGNSSFARTTFADNIAADDGGAINLDDAVTAHFSDAALERNTAENGGALSSCSGCHTSFNNTSLTHNIARGEGGAMTLRGGSANFSGGGNLVHANAALLREGGGIHSGGADLAISIADTLIVGNTPNNVFDSDGIYTCLYSPTSQVCDWSGEDNWGCPGDDSDWDFMCATPTLLVAPLGGQPAPCGWDSDHACSSLSDALSYGSVTLVPGRYDQREDLPDVMHPVSVVSVSGDPSDTVLDCNGYGGFRALGVTLRGLTMRNCTRAVIPFIGGAVLAVPDSVVTIDNCVFESCRAGSGGALYISDGGELSVSDTVFVGNSAWNMGGAVYLQSSSSWFNHTLFVGNAAARSAGALHLHRAESWFNNTVFDRNSAGLYGGALYLYGAESWFNNTVFDRNSAGLYGGALTVSGSPLIEFSGESNAIRGNNATVSGGGVYVGYDVHFQGFSQDLLSDNLPNDVSVSSSNCLSCPFWQTCTWTGAENSYACGCPDDGSDLERACSASTWLVAATGGQPFPCGWDAEHACEGIIEFLEKELPVSLSLLPGVHVHREYLPWTWHPLAVKSSSGNPSDTVIDCSSRGGFHVAELTLEGVTMRNCRRHAGGAVYGGYNSRSIVIDNCVFETCRARDWGGAVYSRGGSLAVSNTWFVDNRASIGGALYSESEQVLLSSVTMSRNVASREGGGAYLDGFDVLDFSGEVNDNSAETGGGLFFAQEVDSFLDPESLRVHGNTPQNIVGGGMDCGVCEFGWCSLSEPVANANNTESCICSSDAPPDLPMCAEQDTGISSATAIVIGVGSVVLLLSGMVAVGAVLGRRRTAAEPERAAPAPPKFTRAAPPPYSPPTRNEKAGPPPYCLTQAAIAARNRSSTSSRGSRRHSNRRRSSGSSRRRRHSSH